MSDAAADSDDEEDMLLSSLITFPAKPAKSPSGSSPSSTPATSSDDRSDEDGNEELFTEVTTVGPSTMDEDTSITLRRASITAEEAPPAAKAADAAHSDGDAAADETEPDEKPLEKPEEEEEAKPKEKQEEGSACDSPKLDETPPKKDADAASTDDGCTEASTEATLNGKQEAVEPESVDSHFGGEEEKQEDLERFKLPNGVLKLPDGIDVTAAESLIRRVECANFLPAEHTAPCRHTLVGGAGEILFIYSASLSRVKSTRGGWNAIAHEMVATDTIADGQWMVQGALFFHGTTADAITALKQHYGVAAVQGWHAVLFNEHAGTQPTLLPLEKLKCVRASDYDDAKPSTGLVYAGMREWLERLSKEGAENGFGNVALPNIVPFETAQQALKTWRATRSVVPKPKPKDAKPALRGDHAARPLSIPDGAVCKITRGTKPALTAIVTASPPDKVRHGLYCAMTGCTLGQNTGSKRYYSAEEVEMVPGGSISSRASAPDGGDSRGASY